MSACEALSDQLQAVWRINKMFTTISTRTGFLTAALVAAAFSNAPLKAQHVVTSQVMLPLHTTVSVNTDTLHDQVALSGNLHLVTQTPGDPVHPDDPIRIITTLVDVTGTGQTTGL